MECKHPYYKFVHGRLVCSLCGEESPRSAEVAKEQGIEDKIAEKPETKIIPPEVKRQKKVVKKGKAGKKR